MNQNGVPQFPIIGIGVIIVNQDQKVLIGKRKNSHAPYYSIPGGHLETGESFEACAIREVYEETGLKIHDPEVIAVTNNLETYRSEGKHYISVILLAREYSGKLLNREPNKCEGYQWQDPENLAYPHFDASKQGIDCFLKNRFYQK